LNGLDLQSIHNSSPSDGIPVISGCGAACARRHITLMRTTGIQVRSVKRLCGEASSPGCYEMTGIPVWNTFKIVLGFGLSLTKITGGHDLCDDLSWPETRRINVRDRVFSATLFAHRSYRKWPSVACADVVAMTIQCGRESGSRTPTDR